MRRAMQRLARILGSSSSKFRRDFRRPWPVGWLQREWVCMQAAAMMRQGMREPWTRKHGPHLSVAKRAPPASCECATATLDAAGASAHQHALVLLFPILLSTRCIFSSSVDHPGWCSSSPISSRFYSQALSLWVGVPRSLRLCVRPALDHRVPPPPTSRRHLASWNGRWPASEPGSTRASGAFQLPWGMCA